MTISIINDKLHAANRYYNNNNLLNQIDASYNVKVCQQRFFQGSCFVGTTPSEDRLIKRSDVFLYFKTPSVYLIKNGRSQWLARYYLLWKLWPRGHHQHDLVVVVDVFESASHIVRVFGSVKIVVELWRRKGKDEEAFIHTIMYWRHFLPPSIHLSYPSIFFYSDISFCCCCCCYFTRAPLLIIILLLQLLHPFATVWSWPVDASDLFVRRRRTHRGCVCCCCFCVGVLFFFFFFIHTPTFSMVWCRLEETKNIVCEEAATKRVSINVAAEEMQAPE